MIALVASLSLAGGPLDTWGAGDVAAVGNAGVAARSPYAAWYNPAALRARHFDFGFEHLWGDVQLEADGAALPNTSPHGVTLGAVANTQFLGTWRGNLGFAVHLPFRGPWTWNDRSLLVDEQVVAEPELPRWEDDPSRADVAVGGSVWIAEWLSAGIGVDISATVFTESWVYIEDIDDSSTATKAQDVDLGLSAHPYAGLLAIVGDPWGHNLRIGLVGRTGRSLRDDGDTHIFVFGGHFLYRYELRHYQAPPSLSVGLQATPADMVQLSFEARYEAWSATQDPHALSLKGSWKNTLDLRGGASIGTDRARVMIGVMHSPSPAAQIVPNTRVLDVPSTALTAGASLDVGRTRGGRTWTVVAGLQARGFSVFDVGDASAEGRAIATRLGVKLEGERD